MSPAFAALMGTLRRRDSITKANHGIISLKRITALLLLAVTLATVWIHEAWVLRPTDSKWSHFAPIGWWLAPHVLASATALIVGPCQFSSTLRGRNKVLHRWLGRVYAVSAIIASMLALYIVLTFEEPFNRGVMGSMAALWLVTTLFAWVSARNRNFVQHRLWVARSYCLTFTFVGTRFIPDVILPGMDYYSVTTLYWLLIVASLMLPDVVVGRHALVSEMPKRLEI
jgi:uncharacterized membrane protein